MPGALVGWALLTSILVLVTENLFVLWNAWWAHWWVFVPLAVAINVCVFKMVTAGTNLPTAFVVFATSNLLLRVTGSAWWLHQPIGRGTWLAVGCYLIGLGLRGWYHE